MLFFKCLWLLISPALFLTFIFNLKVDSVLRAERHSLKFQFFLAASLSSISVFLQVSVFLRWHDGLWAGSSERLFSLLINSVPETADAHFSLSLG